jgi:alcohol dehydrogenase (NADP+)
MKQPDNLRSRKLPLRGGSGTMPAIGFGTLIPDATETRNSTRAALEAGFRHFDCADRYRNEEQIPRSLGLQSESTRPPPRYCSRGRYNVGRRF